MNQTAAVLNVPLLVTEHYTKAFGKTVEESAKTFPEEYTLFEKTKFSMLTEEVESWLSSSEKAKGRTEIVLYGIEAHVCIQQTCLDLLEKGYGVHLVLDAVSSQRKYDREVAIERMKQAGAQVTTAEAIIFELLGNAKDEKFKPMMSTIKLPGPTESFD